MKFGDITLTPTLENTGRSCFITYRYAESATVAIAQQHPNYAVQRLRTLENSSLAPYIRTLENDAAEDHIYFFFNISNNPHWLTTVKRLLTGFIKPELLPSFLTSGPDFHFLALSGSIDSIPRNVAASFSTLVSYSADLPVFLYGVMSNFRQLGELIQSRPLASHNSRSRKRRSRRPRRGIRGV